MLKEANLASMEYAPAETDRKSTYDVPRPRYLHISPKFKGFRFEDYMPPGVEPSESTYKQPFDPDRDFGENALSYVPGGCSFAPAKEYDISDDEGDPESGRISPCTFRLLAEGCAKQNPKANQVFMAEDVNIIWNPFPKFDAEL